MATLVAIFTTAGDTLSESLGFPVRLSKTIKHKLKKKQKFFLKEGVFTI